jgi:hypothetical protein
VQSKPELSSLENVSIFEIEKELRSKGVDVSKGSDFGLGEPPHHGYPMGQRIRRTAGNNAVLSVSTSQNESFQVSQV